MTEKPGVKAVILYTYDDSTVGSSVVSMEVDKAAFMNVIKDSQFAVKAANPMKFSQDNGFFALLEGEDSAFSFATSSGTADCDCKCVQKIVSTTTPAAPTPTIPITTFNPKITTSRTSTAGPTYLPPTTLPPTLPPTSPPTRTPPPTLPSITTQLTTANPVRFSDVYLH